MGLDFGEVARLVVSAFAQQIFRAGFVHSDPHPGNVLVRKGADGHAEIVVRPRAAQGATQSGEPTEWD